MTARQVYWLVRDAGGFLIPQTGAQPFPLAEAPTAVGEGVGVLALGEWQGLPCFAVERERAPEALLAVADAEWLPLRAVFGARRMNFRAVVRPAVCWPIRASRRR